LYFGSEAARLEAEVFFAEEAEEEHARSSSNSRKTPDPEPEQDQDVADQLRDQATIQSDEEPPQRPNLGSAAPPLHATRARRLRRQNRTRNPVSNLIPTPSEAAAATAAQGTDPGRSTTYSSAAAVSGRNERADETAAPLSLSTLTSRSPNAASYAARVAELSRQRQELSDRVRQRIRANTQAGLPAPTDELLSEAPFMDPPNTRGSTVLHESPLRNEVLSARDLGRRNREESAANRAANPAVSSASRSQTASRLSSRFAPAHRHQQPQQNAQSNGATAPSSQDGERLPSGYPPMPWDNLQQTQPLSPFSRQYNEDLRQTLHHFIQHGSLPDVLPQTLQQRDRERAEAERRARARERRINDWGEESRMGGPSSSIRQVNPGRSSNGHTFAGDAGDERMHEYEDLLAILSGSRGRQGERRTRNNGRSNRTDSPVFSPPSPPGRSSPTLNPTGESIQPTSTEYISAPSERNENETDPELRQLLAYDRHMRGVPYVSVYRPPLPSRSDSNVDNPNNAFAHMQQPRRVFVYDPSPIPGRRRIVVHDPPVLNNPPIPEQETPVENRSVPVDTTPAAPPPAPAQQERTLTRLHHHHHHWHYHHHHYPGTLPEDETQAGNWVDSPDNPDSTGHPRTGDDASDIEFTMTQTHHTTGETSDATRSNIR
ncbi:hypothetical protein KEM56_000177, partial [Ascosphaera pollenicola]